jgi:hypothetical protein
MSLEAGMTEETQQQDPVALLVQAVNQLSPSDRDQVFAWLLRVGWRHYSPAAAVVSWGRAEDRAGMFRIFQEAKAAGSAAHQPGSAGQQVVPVRFPADQHARLREWCTQHGFSMATVIRGLVSKFLEDQLPEHN